MKRLLTFALAFILCVCAASGQAVLSPMLENFAGSGIKKQPAGTLQKTLLDLMRAAGSTGLTVVVTEYDSFVDAENHEALVREAEIEVIFTPEIDSVRKDGTADFLMQLPDPDAFSGKEAAVVVGIQQGADEGAGVKYIEIPAEAADGRVQARFPAWVVAEMRRAVSSGRNCVCLVISREREEAPDAPPLEWLIEEDSLTL